MLRMSTLLRMKAVPPVAEIIRITVTEVLAYRRATKEASEPAVASSSPPTTSE